MKIEDYDTDRIWLQLVDLEVGSWSQEYHVGDVLIWADTWDTSSTEWNFSQTGKDHTSLLSTTGEDGEDSVDSKTNGMLAAGVLSLTLLGYCVFVGHGAQKTNDNFQRA